MTIFDRIFRSNTGLGAGQTNKPPQTALTRFFDNAKVRVGLTAVLSLLLLVNVILAGTAFHVSPNGVYGALAWQVVLSLGIWIYSLVFFWRNLNGTSESRAKIWFCLNLGVVALWATAFFSLAIELGNNKDSLDFEPDGKTVTTYKPAIGCVVLDLAFLSIFAINAIYVFIRMRQLYPKYAEISEEHQAFDAAMTEGDYTGHGDEEEGQGGSNSGGGGSGSGGATIARPELAGHAPHGGSPPYETPGGARPHPHPSHTPLPQSHSPYGASAYRPPGPYEGQGYDGQSGYGSGPTPPPVYQGQTAYQGHQGHQGYEQQQQQQTAYEGPSAYQGPAAHQGQAAYQGHNQQSYEQSYEQTAYSGYPPGAQAAHSRGVGPQGEPRYPAQGPYADYGGHQPFPSEGA